MIKMRCIYVDRSIIKEFTKGNIKSRELNNYTKDIVEITINKKYIKDIKLKYPKDVQFVNIQSNIFNICDKKIILGWSLVYNYRNLPQLVILAERPKVLNIKNIIHLEQKYTMASPKAIAINKHHRIWGKSIFCRLDGKNLTKTDFIKYYNASKLIYNIPITNSKTPVEDYIKSIDVNCYGKTQNDRYILAQNWLKKLFDHNILTYEDAWIGFAKSLANIYVKNGYSFFETTYSHSITEYFKIILYLKCGSKEFKKNVVWNKFNHNDPSIKEI